MEKKRKKKKRYVRSANVAEEDQSTGRDRFYLFKEDVRPT